MPLAPKSLFGSSLLVRWLPLLAFCAVIAHHFWFVTSHAINIPYQDDIYDFLRFVNLVETAETTGGAFQEWFSQYNDHRTNASRLQVYAAYLVAGEVNFRTLTVLAHLALPLMLLLFYLSVRGEAYRWLYLLVAALLLLNLRSHTVVLWSQPAFAYYYVFFYAFACLFALHKVTVPKFVLAAVWCSLASFTYASGQVVWLLGLASLLHQWLVTGRKSFLYPLLWLLVAVAMLMVWRIGFIGHVQDIPSAQILSAWPSQLIDPPPRLDQALARYASWLLVILGCAFIDSSTLGAGVFGFVMLALLSFITIRFYKHEDIRLALCCWFVVASAAAVSMGRALMLSSDYVLQQRYNFFSVVLLCTLALLVLVRFAVFRTSAVYLVVLLAGIYWAWAWRHFEAPLQETMNYRYSDFNEGRYWVVSKTPSESDAIVRESIAAGIYNPPCRPFPMCETPTMPKE